MRHGTMMTGWLWVLLLFFPLTLSGCGFEPDIETVRTMSEVQKTEKEKGNSSFSEKNNTSEDFSENTSDGESHHTSESIYVHVCGCVRHPGLYKADSGIRAGEAIELAGGFTKEADISAVNLAAIVSDGMQLYVPSEKENARSDNAGNGTGRAKRDQTAESDGLLNLNEATEAELGELPGIGEKRAGDIVAYREENGPFSSIDKIKNVSGIGDGIFERIKDLITV